ncbi:hypothetical protein GGX14DRAFT_600814 [Mycena pura]|uniref:C2H2-type domain-containing protein n=1 Tax=Mycena pura TaxID=153505 RepID=A0AAD6Y0R2_9AGAR|nr:hypothetical protein GGX14DRAFT_600814 [Mycena pura]
MQRNVGRIREAPITPDPISAGGTAEQFRYLALVKRLRPMSWSWVAGASPVWGSVFQQGLDQELSRIFAEWCVQKLSPNVPRFGQAASRRGSYILAGGGQRRPARAYRTQYRKLHSVSRVSPSHHIAAEFYGFHTAGKELGVNFRSFVEFEALRKETRDLAERCDQWECDILAASDEEYAVMLDNVMTGVAERLAAEGWDVQDIYEYWGSIRDTPHLYRIPRLTSRSPSAHYPRGLMREGGATRARAQGSHQQPDGHRALRGHPRAAHACGRVAARALPPAAHDHGLPSARAAYQRPFRHVPGSRGPAPAQRALAARRTHVHRRLVRQARLAALLPAADAGGDPAQALERATSVVLARGEGGWWVPPGTGQVPVIGWAEARAIVHWWHGPPEGDSERHIQFSALGSASSRALAVQLEMDPAHATGAQMDAADARFVCANCPSGMSGRQGCEALRWRECVFHDIERNAASAVSHHTPSWRRLSSLATEDVRRCEGEDDFSRLRMWACTLCSHYVHRLAQHTDVVEHVRTRHDIQQPVVGEHLVSFKLAERPRRRRAAIVEGELPALPLTRPSHRTYVTSLARSC